MRTLTLFAVALAGALSDVAVAEPPESAPLTVLSLESGKPTKEKILEFLQGEAEWGGGIRSGYFHFHANGKADYDTGMDDSASSRCRCEASETYSVSTNTIRFRCRYVCWTSVSESSDEARNTVEQRDFLFHVLYVSSDALMFRDQSDRLWIVHQCDKALKHCYASSYGQGFHYRTREIFDSIVIQLIPGSADRALFSAIEHKLQGAAASLGNAAFFPRPRPTNDLNVVLVEGTIARAPRRLTEVYYVSGLRQSETALALESAELVARQLEPIVGKVSVKKWPGAWPAQVIVVAGRERTRESDAGEEEGTGQ